MPQINPARLAAAKFQREQRIEALQACVCTWPLDVYRNGSGHASDCPAHVLWIKIRELEQATR